MKNLIIDGNNFFYRGMITFGKPLVEEDHTVTYNFIRNVKATVEQFFPDRVFIALEGHPVHRYALYPEYKANRIIKVGEAKKADSKSIFNNESKLILDMCQHMPFALARHKDYEADDVINTLVAQMPDDDNIVVTGDTDYYQLLETSKAKVYNPNKKVFLEKFKYPYVVHKSLVGDKSDNIPRLVSDRRAEEILDNPDLLKEFLAEEESSADFNINFELIKFKEVPLDSLEIEYNLLDMDYLKARWEQYKFPSLLKPSYLTAFTEVFEKLVY